MVFRHANKSSYTDPYSLNKYLKIDFDLQNN